MLLRRGHYESTYEITASRMICKLWILGLFLFAWLACGCTSSEMKSSSGKAPDSPEQSAKSFPAKVVPATTSAQTTLPPTTPAPEISISSEPLEICTAFLNALQTGDAMTAQQLLTTRAIMETQRANLELAFPGDRKSTFKLLPAQYASQRKQIAQVDCFIGNSDGSSAASIRISWMLKLQTSGWKISGMTFQNDANGQQELLSFENPADISRIQGSLTDSPEIGGSSGPRQAKTDDGAQSRIK